MRGSIAARVCAIIAASLLVGMMPIAEGQGAADAPPPAAQQPAATSNQLAEVVVTAEKRTENVQEIPQSIAVLNSNQLQEQHVYNLEDLARVTPDLANTNPNGGLLGNGNYSIRGVSSAGASTGSSLGQTTIGVYLDDVAMATATGGSVGDTSLQVFDLSRIEVLRGPQGTLYGSGAMGGTIRYVSNLPDPTAYSGSVLGTLSATHSGGINYIEQAVGNIPLMQNRLALRVGAQVTGDSGYVNNYNPYTGVQSPNVNNENSAVIRTSLRYVSQDNTFTVTPAVFLQRANQYGTPQAMDGTHYLSEWYLPEPATDRIFIPSLTLNKDFGFADLTSATSYFWRYNALTMDETYVLEAPIFQFAYPTPFDLWDRTTQFAEELRLTSKARGASGRPFDWIVGIYYSDNHTTRWAYLHPQNYNTFNSLLVNTYGAAGAAAFGESPYGANFFTAASWLHVGQLSEFGEFNYSPIKPLTLTVGLRYLNANQVAYNAATGYYNGPVPLVYTLGLHANHLSPKFAIKYDYAPNSQVYATAVEGFRLGGSDEPIPLDPATFVGAACLQDLQAIGRNTAPTTYKPDSLWSYELGDKSTLFDNRLSIEAAIFHILWKDVQQDIILTGPNTSCGDYDFITNAGQAKSDGADLSFNAKATSWLELYAAGNITHAEITSPAPDTGEFKGTWLIGVPRWQASTGFRMSDPMLGGTGYIQMYGHWIGPSHQVYSSLLPGFYVSQYFLLDMNLGIDYARWQVSLFAQNLLNNDHFQYPGTSPPYPGVAVRPLTIGVTAQAQF
jgi:outer membrane receptor protein involved in Fe transport